ncbi:AraC family transcriptional regulator [uncultured Tenacibaculum sp.]|uniref:AraC family transcriptional regulator n=1 Tax=uncultured Tenacibaculum sp. TaxID=174713 RepID=UPI002636F51D|nr:AraC family transcriptional regulator [uncultured Tenacibaculum sp.]
MLKIKLAIFLIIEILLTSNTFIYSQNDIDSLSKLNYEDLKVNFQKTQIDSIIAFKHAKAYLLKAKKKKDTLKMCNAYYFLSRLYSSKKEIGIAYSDSILNISKKIKNHPKYPAVAYERIGLIYHIFGEFNEALEYYLKALKYSLPNTFERASIKFDIAALKYRLGLREEAKELFKKHIDDIKKLQFPRKEHYYYLGLYAYCDALIYTKKHDSAQIIINQGIEGLKNSNNDIIRIRFIMNSGINNYYLKNYNKALSLLLKSKEIIKNQQDNLTTAINNSYIGKTYYVLGEKEKGIKYLKESHEFLSETNDVALEILEGYDFIIDYYKNKQDYKNQLFYINALMNFDSVYNKKYRTVSKQITKGYEIPNLMKEKENIISNLKDNQKKNTVFKGVFTSVISILTLVTIFLIKRNRDYKKRFEDILNSEENTKPEIIQKKTSGISEELTKEILQKLNDYENTKFYLNKRATLSSLAKKLNTNSTYLSKVINSKKGTNFSTYLNNLRIDYAIKKLKKDPQLRAYTIKSIALECGFNNQETFSLAFKKRTKLYPSYFIKELQKKDKNTNLY